MAYRIDYKQLAEHWGLDEWPDELIVYHQLTPNVVRRYVDQVRCRDCKHYRDGIGENGRRYSEPHCGEIGELAYGALFEVSEDCYCAWGERR